MPLLSRQSINKVSPVAGYSPTTMANRTYEYASKNAASKLNRKSGRESKAQAIKKAVPLTAPGIYGVNDE